MDPIPIENYRMRRSRTQFVREERGRHDARRAGLRSEHIPGDRVLGDLALAWDDPVTAGRVLARFAAVRVLYGGPDRAESLAALDEWARCVIGTEEGRALRVAVQTDSPAERYRALRVAAREASGLGHRASALALRSLMFDVAVHARRRRAAIAAARAASRSAAAVGAPALARRWSRRAKRLGRRMSA